VRRFSGVRPRSIVGVLAAVLAAGIGAGAASQPVLAEPTAAVATRPPVVPPELAVPAGNRLVAVLPATGVQVYQCTAGAWSFVEPVASLARGRHPVAIHFRGPSWESIHDGSLVEGRAIASVPATGTIPLLLLQATRVRGDGLFGHTSYIQRLATSGGAAPTTACTDGATQAVRYTARYYFYAPA
jgi:hypothetical protein